MWTVRFWKDAVERAIKSAAQAAVLYFGGGLVDAWHANWSAAGSIAAAAAVLSVLTSLGSSFTGDPASASAVDVSQ